MIDDNEHIVHWDNSMYAILQSKDVGVIDSRLSVKLDKLTMNGLINVYFQLFANLLVKYKDK